MRWLQGHKVDGLNMPDGKPERCQCVWDHRDPTFFTTIAQCTGHKSTEHNFFCGGCANEHGEAMRKEAEKQAKEAGIPT